MLLLTVMKSFIFILYILSNSLERKKSAYKL